MPSGTCSPEDPPALKRSFHSPQIGAKRIRCISPDSEDEPLARTQGKRLKHNDNEVEESGAQSLTDSEVSDRRDSAGYSQSRRATGGEDKSPMVIDEQRLATDITSIAGISATMKPSPGQSLRVPARKGQDVHAASFNLAVNDSLFITAGNQQHDSERSIAAGHANGTAQHAAGLLQARIPTPRVSRGSSTSPAKARSGKARE